MKPRKPSRVLLVAAALAALGWLLITVPPRVMAGYAAARAAGPVFGYGYLALVSLGGAMLAGVVLWGALRLARASAANRREAGRRAKNPSQLSRREREAELGENLRSGRSHAEGSAPLLRSEIERALADLEAKRDARRLEVVAFGTVSSGKSSLLNALAGREVFRADVAAGTTTQRQSVPWPDSDAVALVDTPGLAEVEGESRAADAALAAADADLVLVVVDGPLKAYEHRLLERLAAMEKRVVVCLNKEDWYDPPQLADLVDQLREQAAVAAGPKDIVAVRSRPTTRPVVRVAADGSRTDGEVEVPADISPLAERLAELVRDEGQDLLLANLLMRSRGLVDGAKQRVLATLDAEADRLIDRYMWAAAGVAAVNPVPLLDLAGGSAMAVKMVLDLASVYKQRVDAEVVTEMLAQLGKNLIAMLGASAATPALGAAIGSLLKTVPGVGWVAGGLLQGAVQALVTRWIGRVFRAHYRAGMTPPEGGLAEIARREWAVVTSPDELRKLIRVGRERLGERAAPRG